MCFFFISEISAVNRTKKYKKKVIILSALDVKANTPLRPLIKDGRNTEEVCKSIYSKMSYLYVKDRQ